MQRRGTEPRVFFPWERRRGLRSVLQRARARQVILSVGLLSALYVFGQRERRAKDIRQTRAEITVATSAIAAWRADHDGACPGSLGDLVIGGYVRSVPHDAWNHPLRVTCPGRRDPAGFEVASDGPDGEMGGMDKVE